MTALGLRPRGAVSEVQVQGKEVSLFLGWRSAKLVRKDGALEKCFQAVSTRGGQHCWPDRQDPWPPIPQLCDHTVRPCVSELGPHERSKGP